MVSLFVVGLNIEAPSINAISHVSGRSALLPNGSYGRLEPNRRRITETTQASQTITDRTATAWAGIIPSFVPNTITPVAENISRMLATSRPNLKTRKSIKAAIRRRPATRGISTWNQTIQLIRRSRRSACCRQRVTGRVAVCKRAISIITIGENEPVDSNTLRRVVLNVVRVRRCPPHRLIGFDALCSEETSLRVSPLLVVQRQELRQSGTLGALRKNHLRGRPFRSFVILA